MYIKLDDICEKITDGTHITPKYVDKGVPFLRVTDITETNDSKKFITETEHKELTKRCNPQKGDILLTKNGTIGVAKVIDWDYEFSIFVSLCLIKPRKELVNNDYLAMFLNTNSALEQMTSRSKSGTITNLHLVEIKELMIPLPDIETQGKLVSEFNEQKKIIESNQKLIGLMQEKIDEVLSEI